MKISGHGNQIKMGATKSGDTEKKVEIDPKYVDILDKKNALLKDAVNQGQVSKNIAQTVEQLRKEMASQPQEKVAENTADKVTKCYMPCYDEGPWFREADGTQTKCYMPCYDEGPWFRETEGKGLPGGGPLCYAPMKTEEKGLPGGGPLCYAPMKTEEKKLPGGGPLCYAPMSSN